MSLSALDIVLISIAEWEKAKKKLYGRTRLHKTIFLAQKLMNIHGIKFRPYYYGPYSDELAEALNTTVTLHFSSFNKEQIPINEETVEYVYNLSEDGKNYLDHLKGKEKADYDKWEKKIGIIVNCFSDSTSSEMASAAKVLFLLINNEEKMQTIDELKNRAKDKYGWDIKDRSIEKSFDDLEQIFNN